MPRTTENIAFIGFGEAASAFVRGWSETPEPVIAPNHIAAYDIKTDASSNSVVEQKWRDYERAGVVGCAEIKVCLQSAHGVFSTVTADQALVAARNAAGHLQPGALYFDCNSCAPETKRQAAELIEGADGRYVDVAVMAPVHPTLHKTPLLICGPHTEAALTALSDLQMSASVVAGDIGASSSIKMIRSVMVKGLEALTVECVLSACQAGVDQQVLDSLEATFPGFGWQERAGYMLERVMTHGLRRAAEMREVAATVEALDFEGRMASATADWQQRVGKLGLVADSHDYKILAKALIDELCREIPKNRKPA